MGPISARGKHAAAAEAVRTMSLFPTAADALPAADDLLADGIRMADNLQVADGLPTMGGLRMSGGLLVGRTISRVADGIRMADNLSTADGIRMADDFSGGGRSSNGGRFLGRVAFRWRAGRDRARMCVNLAKNDYLEPGNQSSFRAA